MPTVLLVDDEEAVRDALGRVLRLAGYDVAECASGTLAMKFLRMSKFDVMVLDLHMPDTDGLELIRQLRKNKLAIPKTLAISGHFDPSLLQTAEALGVAATLPKPFPNGELLAAIERLLKPDAAPETGGAVTQP